MNSIKNICLCFILVLLIIIYIFKCLFLYRAGRVSILNCANHNSFPCNWANTGYHFVNQSQIDSAMSDIDKNCSLEAMLEQKLIEVQRSDEMYDIYLDLMKRWEAVGGGLAVGSMLVQPALTCPQGNNE